MTNRLASTVLVLGISGSLLAGLAHADVPIENWWRDAGREPGWGKPCRIEFETRDGTSTKLVTCAKGVEPPWVGLWKDEFNDGDCRVKLEANRSTFKAVVRCPSR